MKIDKFLPEQVKDLLTEESLSSIREAFEAKANLLVEAALMEQDELYATKLQELVSAIDKDHTFKLKRVVEAVDRTNAGKLIKVVKKYEREINENALKFKDTLVESISQYLEEYIDESIPSQAIEEATKNRTATEVLSNLRKVLAVDSALMSESIKEAVIDGKNQNDILSKEVEALKKENKILKESYTKTKADLLLETKTVNLADKKRDYIKRALGDKTPAFIEENFDYTLRLFERKEQEQINAIKEQAFANRKIKADAPREQEPVKIKQPSNPYLKELERMK
jgi:hypothetical protein